MKLSECEKGYRRWIDPKATSRCPHLIETLPYLDWHMDAKLRMKSGEKQKKCHVCGKWIWASHFKKGKP